MKRELRELVDAPVYAKASHAEGLIIDLVVLLDEVVSELETLKGKNPHE